MIEWKIIATIRQQHINKLYRCNVKMPSFPYHIETQQVDLECFNFSCPSVEIELHKVHDVIFYQ